MLRFNIRLCEFHNHSHTVDITLYYTVFPMPHVEEANKIIVIVIIIVIVTVDPGKTAAASGDDDKCSCGTGLLHPNLILGLIIWLLILTLLVIMLIILMTWRRKEETQRDSLRQLQRESPWGGQGMREDEWKVYNPETASTH